MARKKLTQTPNGARGLITQELFDYMTNAIASAVDLQEQNGGGLKANSLWQQYRDIYAYHLEHGDVNNPDGSSELWNNPKVNLVATTIRRQWPKLRYDYPEIMAKATNPDDEYKVLDVKNHINHYIRYEIPFADTIDRLLLFALLNPYGVLRFGWQDDSRYGRAMVEAIKPEHFLVDPTLEWHNIDEAAYVVEVRAFTRPRLESIPWFNKRVLSEVKPNVVPRDKDGKPITKEEFDKKYQDGEFPKGWKYHNDTIIVYFFYDGFNKTITAIPKDHKFEIGHRKYPKNGLNGKYPFEVLMFNPQPDRFYGPSDIDRYGSTAEDIQKWESWFQAIAKANIPKLIIDQDAFDQANLDALNSSRPWANVKFRGREGQRIDDIAKVFSGNGVNQDMLIAIDRLYRILSQQSEIFEQERSGSPSNVDTATQASIVEGYSQGLSEHRKVMVQRMLERSFQKIFAMIKTMITKKRSIPWVIKQRPEDEPGKAYSTIEPKDVKGEFSFEIDVTSGDGPNKILQKRNIIDFVSLLNQLGIPPTPETMEYLIKKASQWFGFNPDRIELQGNEETPPPGGEGMIPGQMPNPAGAIPQADQGAAMDNPAAVAESNMSEKGVI